MKKKKKIIIIVISIIIVLCLIGIITYFVIKNNNTNTEDVSSLELNIEYEYISEEDKVLVTITTNKPMLKLDLAYVKEGVEITNENGEEEIIEDNYEYTLDEEFTLNEDSLIATRYYTENDTYLYRITFEDGETTFEYVTISQIAVVVDMEALENTEDTSEEETDDEETTEEIAVADTTSSSTDTSTSTDTSSSSSSTPNTSTSSTTASDTSSTTTSSTTSSTDTSSTSSTSSSSSSSSSSSEDDLSYWCVGGGSVHVEGDGENEHGYYSTWDEAYQALLEYTASWSSMQYKVSSCACGLYYFWCVQN